MALRAWKRLLPERTGHLFEWIDPALEKSDYLRVYVKRKTHVLHDNDSSDDNQMNSTHHQFLFQVLIHDRARILNAQHRIDVIGEHQTLQKLTERKQPIKAE